MGDRIDCRLSTVTDLQFLENVFQMGLYCGNGHGEADGDLLVAHASRNQSEDVKLTRGQPVRPGEAAGSDDR